MRPAFCALGSLSVRKVRPRWVCAASPPGRGVWDLDGGRSFGAGAGREREERVEWDSDRGGERGRGQRRDSRRGGERGGGERRRAPRWDLESQNGRNDRGGAQRGGERNEGQRRAPRWDMDVNEGRGERRASQRGGVRDSGERREPRWDTESQHGRNERREPQRSGWASGRREGDAQARWASKRGDDDSREEEPTWVQRALSAEGDDLLYGVSPVLLALTADRRSRFGALYVQEGKGTTGGVARKAENDAGLEKVLKMAREKEIPVTWADKGDLNMLARNRPHQGLVLQTSPLDYEELKTLPKVSVDTVNSRGAPPCYLVLDEVTDPQNAGALLRSAHFLGADGVIACRRNSCRLTPVVSKASAGALEIMRVQGVASMPRFLRSASTDGWRVIGTALSADAVPAKSICLDRPTLVVMGSEGRGLRTMVRDACDTLVRIDGAPQVADDPIDSLNVSVAGAVTLFQLLGR